MKQRIYYRQLKLSRKKTRTEDPAKIKRETRWVIELLDSLYEMAGPLRSA